VIGISKSEDKVGEGAGASNTGSTVIVEEVAAAAPDPQPDTDVEELSPASSGRTDLSNALSTIQQLREEIKDLLNRVELQRYELEKLGSRQRDLYGDLDQRLRKQERLVLTVPAPVMPSVDSIVVEPKVAPPSEPTPMVAGTEQVLPSTELSIQDTPEITVINESQDETAPIIALGEETVDLVVEPTPMVAGIDLPVPSSGSGAVVTVQSSSQIETQGSKAQEEHQVSVEQLVESATEVVSQVITIAVEPNEKGVSNGAVEIGTPTSIDTSPNQPAAVQSSGVSEEITSAAPVGLDADEQATVEAAAMMSTAVTLGEQDAYDHAFNMLKQSRYSDAAEEFANFLRQYRNSALTDDAWYWMAEAHYVTGDFERALIAFNTVASYFVNSPRIPASRLKIGYIQYEKADYESARETLTELLRDFPAHRVAVSAEARLKKINREGR
jgi:tol-pal system protein YbgF